MTKGVRLLGHPVHAALSHFPLALLSVAPLADAAAWLLSVEALWQVGFWCLVGGLVTAIPTAASGLFDFAALQTTAVPEKSMAPQRQRRVADLAARHMLVMLTAVSLSAAGLIVRGGAAGAVDAPVLVLLLEGTGAAVLLLGGWLGGELVYGHGVGVRESKRAPKRD